MTRFSIKAVMAMLIVSLHIFAPELTAQSYTPTPVTISKEKVKIDGKVCYSHIVLERQTLFSISKAYNVSIEDIYQFNPTLRESGLKKNGIILIPSTEAIESRKSDKTSAAVSAPVEPETKPSDQEKEIRRKTHTVKWFEDLDVIADKYGVSVEAIMKLNNLEGRKLKNRQKLLIPTGSDMEHFESEEASPASEETAADEAVAEQSGDSVITDSLAADEKIPLIIRKDVTAALLLPMRATGTSSHKGNMDFYSGVLLAISDLSEKGVNTSLKVYDTAAGNFPQPEYIGDCDFIIGPISSGDLTKTLGTDAYGPMVISPLDQRAQSLVPAHSRLIQAPTPYSVQYKDLIDWVKTDRSAADKIIFITEKGARVSEVKTDMTAALDSSGISFSRFSYSILEGRDILSPLMALMTPTGENRVVIASESEAFVNDVVRNLNLIEYQKYSVVLYAPAKIRNFETIDVDNLHNTSLHSCLSYFIDYDDTNVQNFLMKYRALFNTEPTQFSFQGYDIANYFISLVNRYGDKWTEMLDKDSKRMLQSTFRFRKSSENGGYTNTGVRRIVYEEGWKVKETD